MAELYIIFNSIDSSISFSILQNIEALAFLIISFTRHKLSHPIKYASIDTFLPVVECLGLRTHY